MRKFILPLLFLLFSISSGSAQTIKESNNPLGKWKFEAPLAPEGYSSGSIDLSFAGNKYLTAISLTGTDYVITGDKTKVVNDTVTFVVLINGNEIAISLKQESSVQMTGKAVYSEGEIPLTLTKKLPQK